MRKVLFFLALVVSSLNISGQISRPTQGSLTTVSTPQATYNVTAGNGNGLQFWNNKAYKIHMGNGSEYRFGPVQEYSIKMNMNNNPKSGWTWGINAVTPVAALNTLGDFEVKGNFKAKSLVLNDPNSNHTNIQIGHDNADRIYVDNSPGKNAGGGMFFRVTASSDVDTPYGYLDVMTLSDNGTVGIGTSYTHGYKLGVKGRIAAEEIKVAIYNAWPDYVFKEDYKLPTLQEVENHINTNGYLANIPSAAEVAENGIMLGEMNAKLLEKIEELTLYTIAQEKEIKILKEGQINNKSLQQRVEYLEKLIIDLVNTSKSEK